eukprot:c388_g1_i1.p1 GENE.c388_g1_i1~~c388_g1_i1.p1  ORF type:complete len:391 (+),score=103.47 c388_g1_i1:41-1174(+)
MQTTTHTLKHSPPVRLLLVLLFCGLCLLVYADIITTTNNIIDNNDDSNTNDNSDNHLLEDIDDDFDESEDQKSNEPRLRPRLAYGRFSTQGRRMYQEDRTQATQVWNNTDFFAVYDGHGGSYGSDFAHSFIHKLLDRDIEYSSAPSEALSRAFVKADEIFLDLNVPSGSTLLAVLIRDSQLWAANAGDCRAVLSRDGVAIPLSEDHKPNNPKEFDRLIALGYEPYNAFGTWRVNGLAVSRSLGDGPDKGGVTADPEVREFQLKDDDEFIILASDGLWDVLSSQQAVDIVRTNRAAFEHPKMAAEILVSVAYVLGSLDNISALVVQLQNSRGIVPDNPTATATPAATSPPPSNLLHAVPDPNEIETMTVKPILDKDEL